MPALTDRQQRVIDILESVKTAKSGGIPAEVIESIVDVVGEPDERPKESSSPSTKQTIETEIRLQILQEANWRKRAVLAARLISLSLD